MRALPVSAVDLVVWAAAGWAVVSLACAVGAAGQRSWGMWQHRGRRAPAPALAPVTPLPVARRSVRSRDHQRSRGGAAPVVPLVRGHGHDRTPRRRRQPG